MKTSQPLQVQTDGAVSIVVIDAGVGNLGNVERALRHTVASLQANSNAPKARVTVSSDPAVVAAARVLVLPGVGAFKPPRERLRGPLEDALRVATDGGAYLLGICVGYQLLFESGDEFGFTDGLAFVPGRIAQLPDASEGGANLPHIGWNRLIGCTDHPLLAGVGEECAYFVHSFAARDVPEEWCIASCQHGVSFPAVVARGRVMGTQFHPEKSGEVGLRVLRNFLGIAGVTDVN